MGGADAQPPEMAGWPEGNLLRRHLQVDGLFGAAGDDEHVVPGAAQGRSEEATSVGVAVDGREGRMERDVAAGSSRPRGAGQRTDGEDQGVTGREGIGGVGQVAEEKRGPQSPPTQEASHHVALQRLEADRAGGEVNPGNTQHSFEHLSNTFVQIIARGGGVSSG